MKQGMKPGMKLGIRFASEREKLIRDVSELRGASAEERFEALLELSEFCENLLEASPYRERQLALLEEREQVERERWKELIKRHDRRQAESDTSR